MKHILVLAILLSSSSTFAYNWRRCKAYAFKPSKSSRKPLSGNIVSDLMATTSEGSINSSLDKSIGSSSSTTSYVSSTGACKAFGMAHTERVHYVAGTKTELQREMAEGKGEHFTTLASLFGCNDIGKKSFNGALRARHSQIFNTLTIGSEEAMTVEMTEAVADSETLSANCNPEII